jgi:hypothetical protein
VNQSDRFVTGTSGQTRPLVWVRRIVLYKTVEPIEAIREITFSTGLNIIQGESNEKEESFESGHGIGKTTVCRLIRYCLGEKSFGQKHLADEIKHCFPNAHVGAVIELNGVDWAILRPLGYRGHEYAQQGSQPDSLINSEGPKRYDQFVQTLSTLVLSGVPVTESLTSEQTIQWPHVLAMCSRDQESRYDRFWNWRHTRSESSSPKFAKPKVDAGLCVRAVMGLLDPDEPKLRRELEHLEAGLEKIKAEIRNEKSEPNFHITRLRRTLVNECGIHEASDAPFDDENLVGLPAVTEIRLNALRQEINRIEEQLAPLDRRINMTAASLLEPAELAEQLDAASGVTGEGSDVLLADLENLRNIRLRIREAEAALCRYGRVLIGECSYVRAEVEQIDNNLRQRQQTTLPTVSERDQVAARLAEQAERQRSTVARIRQHLDDLNREKNNLLEQRRNLNDQLRRIPIILLELGDLYAIVQGTKPNTSIQALESRANETAANIDSAKVKLASLVIAQSGRIKKFEERFDNVVKRTLTKDFKGMVEVDEEGIELRIKRGESLSGEAYETLAVLLGDVALLFESNAAHARHPGFLIHDSPREADLNLTIYQRLLDMADSHMREMQQNGEIPFQYIVTTTTHPSEKLQKRSVAKIALSGGTGSLFGRQLETPPPEPSLFAENNESRTVAKS